MPHNLDMILTLTGGLTAALVFGLFTQALRLSPIVGYLLAGVVVGPFTPGFVAHAGLAEQLAEIASSPLGATAGGASPALFALAVQLAHAVFQLELVARGDLAGQT